MYTNKVTTELRTLQEQVLSRMYDAHGAEDSAHVVRYWGVRYEAIRLTLQTMHPDGVNCPAWFCDPDLHSLYSDCHKDAYGYRPWNDVSCQEVEAEFPRMQEVMDANAVADREFIAMCEAQEAEQAAAWAEEEAVKAAYSTDFDHLDIRLCMKAPVMGYMTGKFPVALR